MRILVALSGGIDSSVVAHLLHKEGHELIGVRFTLWSDPLAPAIAEILPSKCCNAQTAARAKSVAKSLNIPLHILDLEREFKATVVDPFLDGYARGLSPNPCIGCNRTLKFGSLIAFADSLGCEKLATGHYARVEEEITPQGTVRYSLHEAADPKKDQSYYLYGLSQNALSRVLFPLGSKAKKDVYSLAKDFGIPLPEYYRESQDLCFFPEKTPTKFLQRHLTSAMSQGTIVRKDGTVVGVHKGLPLYTVGQRRGLGIGGLRVPLEVVSKNVKSNELCVEEKGATLVSDIHLSDLHFIASPPEKGIPHSLECRLRSLSSRLSGTLTITDEHGTFRLHTPVPPQAPGQSLVLYAGSEVIGGGVMV